MSTAGAKWTSVDLAMVFPVWQVAARGHG